MPRFLEKRLKAEYPNNPAAVFGTLNKLGAMKGNQETPKGRAMQAQHVRDVKAGTASGMPHPHANLGKYLHPRKAR